MDGKFYVERNGSLTITWKDIIIIIPILMFVILPRKSEGNTVGYNWNVQWD